MTKILLRKQLAEIFRTYLYDAKKNKARSKGTVIAYFVLFALLMVGLLGGMFTFLAFTLRSTIVSGYGWFYYLIFALAAICIGAFGSDAERRLDAVVYRSKFTPTIFSARQLVSHGHVYVNGVKCNVASRLVKPGDEITLGKKAQEMALVAEAQSLPERDLPEYVAVDGTKATFVRVPTLDEVPYPVKMEPNLVVEFYSR